MIPFILVLAIVLGFLCAVQLTRHLERQQKEKTYLLSRRGTLWAGGMLFCATLSGAIFTAPFATTFAAVTERSFLISVILLVGVSVLGRTHLMKKQNPFASLETAMLPVTVMFGLVSSWWR